VIFSIAHSRRKSTNNAPDPGSLPEQAPATYGESHV